MALASQRSQLEGLQERAGAQALIRDQERWSVDGKSIKLILPLPPVPTLGQPIGDTDEIATQAHVDAAKSARAEVSALAEAVRKELQKAVQGFTPDLTVGNTSVKITTRKNYYDEALKRSKAAVIQAQ